MGAHCIGWIWAHMGYKGLQDWTSKKISNMIFNVPTDKPSPFLEMFCQKELKSNRYQMILTTCAKVSLSRARVLNQ